MRLTPSGRMRLAAQWVGLRGLAATGDPVAEWLCGSSRRDVYRSYEEIRARGAVWRSRTGLHVVTSRHLCDQLLRDRRLGVRRADGRSGFPASLGGRQESSALGGSFLELDPPDHTRLRRVIGPALRSVTSHLRRTDQLQAQLDDLLDDTTAAAQSEPVDLISRVASPFPIAVISTLLGIPSADTVDFARIGALVGRALDGVRTVRQREALRVAENRLTMLLTRLLDERAADPRDDLLSVIAEARREGAASSTDAVYTAELLLITGFETTTHLIGNGVATLLARPDRWRQLVEDPGLAPAAVEETLRFDPPVQATGRLAHTDLEVAGTHLPRNSVILVLTAAANRDPAVYSRPDVFDLHRGSEPDHLAFSSGIHHCLGAALARLEGETVFRTLAERFPHLRLAPGARRRPGSTVRGFATLPVVFNPF